MPGAVVGAAPGLEHERGRRWPFGSAAPRFGARASRAIVCSGSSRGPRRVCGRRFFFVLRGRCAWVQPSSFLAPRCIVIPFRARLPQRGRAVGELVAARSESGSHGRRSRAVPGA